MEQLKDNVNTIASLPIKCTLGYLKPTESFCLHAIPGGRTAQEYYSGAKDKQLNYQFAMKSNDQQKIEKTLWMVHNHLEELSVISSADGSFDFDEIKVTNTPFINSEDEKKVFIFMLTIQAKITTYPKGE